MDKVPLPIVKEFEHQASQNLCTLNFLAAFTRVISECNLTWKTVKTVLRLLSNKSKITFKKGANPDKAARNGYEKTCKYLDILNKRILIQQRALVCQSKASFHILQREMYFMGSSVLIRCEAEMTHLEPQLGDTRCQELRSSPFCPTPLFRSQLVKEGEEFLLNKGTSKNTQGFRPYQNQPFCGPHHNKKEAFTGNAPMWVSPLQAVTNRFIQAGETE